MTIRRANENDITRVLDLLSQVLEIHAAIRPDFFISGTTKYTRGELAAIFANDNTPVFVADGGNGEVIGYAFCAIKERPAKPYVRQARELYIDDLCVDGSFREKHVGKALFEFVCGEARRLGCSSVTLNVWEGNDAARRFYDKMGMRPQSTKMEKKLD